MSSKNIDRLIFGCGRLSGGFDKKQSMRLLNEAYDLGIRKFDLAPSYGDGQVESILVDALGSRLHDVQITTKVGLGRPVVSPVKSAIRSFIRPLATSTLRAIKKNPSKVVFSNSIGNMDVNFLKQSFEDSLQRLKIDAIDSLLLHEPSENTITAEVIDFLENLKVRQLITRFGTGTGHDASDIVDIGEIIQFKYTDEFSILKMPKNKILRVHGIFRRLNETSKNVSINSLLKTNSKLEIIFSTRRSVNLKSVIKSANQNASHD